MPSRIPTNWISKQIRKKEDSTELRRQLTELQEENNDLIRHIERLTREIHKVDVEKEFGDQMVFRVCLFLESLNTVRTADSAYSVVKHFVEKISPLMVEYAEKLKQIRSGNQLTNK